MKRIYIFILIFLSLVLCSCDISSLIFIEQPIIDDDTLDLVSELSPTCLQDGNISYYYDEVNDKYYDLSKKEITKEDTILKSLGHTSDDIDPDDYMSYFYCSRCHEYYQNSSNSDFLELSKVTYNEDKVNKVIDDFKSYTTRINNDEILEIKDIELLMDKYREYISILNDANYYFYLLYAIDFNEESSNNLINTNQLTNNLKDAKDKLISAIYYSDMKTLYLNNTYFSNYELSRIEENIELLSNIRINEINNLISVNDNIINQTSDLDTLYNTYYQNVLLKNELANIYGYDNYFEYQNYITYSRTYSTNEIKQYIEYIKLYLIDFFKDSYNLSIKNTTHKTYSKLFTKYDGMKEVVTFFKLLNDDQNDINFYNIVNSCYQLDKAQFGLRPGAYTYSTKAGLYMYFNDSNSYTDTSTLIHESGHYVLSMNCHCQDYCLMETHSQGCEALYYAYQYQNIVEEADKEWYVAQYLYDSQWVTIHSALLSYFELCVYEDYYDGANKFKDGITPDEYEDLFKDISDTYFGGAYKNYLARLLSYYGGENTCYSISYSISLVPCFEIFFEAIDDFTNTVSKYFKTNTFMYDKNFTSSVTYNNIMYYAGFKTCFEEELYIYLNNKLSSYNK